MSSYSTSEINRRLNRSLHKLNGFLSDNDLTAPTIAIITGTSGPKDLIARLERGKKTSFSQLDFPQLTAPGHAGILHHGYMHGKPVFVSQGRRHYYEGASMHEIAHVVRTLCLFGVTHFIFTNASGSMHEEYEVGDIVFITDHVNNMGDSPLLGFPSELHVLKGPGKTETVTLSYFTGMHNAYDAEWREQCKARFGILSPKCAVYTAVHGPEFETPAEIERKYATHAELIGMSTIPEVTAVRQFGAKVLALSLVTNLTGTRVKNITHEQNLSISDQTDKQFSDIIEGCVQVLAPAVANAG